MSEGRIEVAGMRIALSKMAADYQATIAGECDAEELRAAEDVLALLAEVTRLRAEMGIQILSDDGNGDEILSLKDRIDIALRISLTPTRTYEEISADRRKLRAESYKRSLEDEIGDGQRSPGHEDTE